MTQHTYGAQIRTTRTDTTYITADTPERAKEMLEDLVNELEPITYLDFPTLEAIDVFVSTDPLTESELNDADYRGNPKTIAKCNTELYDSIII